MTLNQTFLKNDIRRYHLMQELLSWQRSLDFYIQENSFLKFRLSDLLDNTNHEHFLHVAEEYQTKFLQNDAGMESLKQDIAQLLYKISTPNSRGDFDKISQQQSCFRIRFYGFEKDFLRLVREFDETTLATL